MNVQFRPEAVPARAPPERARRRFFFDFRLAALERAGFSRKHAVIPAVAKRSAGIHHRTPCSTMDSGAAPLRGLSGMTACFRK